MKIGKLYIKISLSFLALFFLTLIVIFGLFVLFPGKHFVTRLQQYTESKVLIVKEVVEDKIRSSPTADLSKNEDLKEFISDFGKILGAKIWLQREDGTIPVKSFSGKAPSTQEDLRVWKTNDYGLFTLYHLKHADFYAVIPIAFPEGGKGGIHVLFNTPDPHGPERGFALGLVFIGIIIGLLTIPISKFIIKPLKELSLSALKIAEGDLSHRARVRSKDEIGELCRTFNHMADRVEKMIKGGRELTANVSHELRTPLARIRIAEELIREELESGKYQDLTRHLDDIREDIEELDHLIGRILDLSKMDIHESPLRIKSVNPVDLLRALLEKYEQAMERKGLHLTTDLSYEPPFMGDREMLETAVSNILDNAVKYTPEDGDIIVKMGSKKDILDLSVINSYEMLAAEDLERIFEPFHRLGKSRETGSGLGLAITRKIIERHGGAIRAFTSGKGLEIRIELPSKASGRIDNGKDTKNPLQ